MLLSPCYFYERQTVTKQEDSLIESNRYVKQEISITSLSAIGRNTLAQVAKNLVAPE